MKLIWGDSFRDNDGHVCWQSTSASRTRGYRITLIRNEVYKLHYFCDLNDLSFITAYSSLVDCKERAERHYDWYLGEISEDFDL